MSSPASRKANKPQVSPAVEVVGLMREAVEHLAAMRAMMEAAQSSPVNNEALPPLLIDKTDMLTPKQAAALAERDVSTVRRWCREFEIGITIGGTLYISKSRLLARLAHIGKRGSE